MPDEILLTEPAYEVWKTVHNAGTEGIDVADIAKATGVHQSQVSAIVTEGAAGEFLKISEREREQLIPSDKGLELFHSRGLPEQSAADFLEQNKGEVPLPQFVEWAKI